VSGGGEKGPAAMSIRVLCSGVYWLVRRGFSLLGRARFGTFLMGRWVCVAGAGVTGNVTAPVKP
jgi:hypothetical protein